MLVTMVLVQAVDMQDGHDGVGAGSCTCCHDGVGAGSCTCRIVTMVLVQAVAHAGWSRWCWCRQLHMQDGHDGCWCRQLHMQDGHDGVGNWPDRVLMGSKKVTHEH